MIKELVEAIKTFSPSQWGIMATIVAGTFSSWMWLDNRFANRDTAEMILNHLIAIDGKVSALINTGNSPERIKEINEAAAKSEEQMRKYLELKNKK